MKPGRIAHVQSKRMPLAEMKKLVFVTMVGLIHFPLEGSQFAETGLHQERIMMKPMVNEMVLKKVTVAIGYRYQPRLSVIRMMA